MRYRDNLPLVGTNLVRTIYIVGSAVVLQLYLKSLGASPFEIALLESVFWLGLFVMSPLWGALSDASGRRKVFLTTSILAAGLIIPFYWYMDTVTAVLALRFGFAIVAAAFPPVALAAMSTQTDVAERGKDLAPYFSSRAIGFLIGWGASGFMVDLLGFQQSFQLFGGIAVLGFIIALIIKGVDTPESVTAQEVWQNAKQRWLPRRTDEALRERGLHYLYFAVFLRKAAIIGTFSLIAVYATDILGFSASFLGIVLALNPLSQILFLDFFGGLTDKVGRKKVFLFGLVATIPIPFLLTVAYAAPVFALVYLLVGFSFAALVEGSAAFIGDVAPDHRQGEFMGFRKSAQGLAGFLGPITAGLIATVYGYQAMFYVLGGLTILATLVAWLGIEESLDETSSNPLHRDAYDVIYAITRRFQ